MQGRLSPILNNQIQSFPFGYWVNEIQALKDLGIKNLEWTIDQYLIDMNPLINSPLFVKNIFRKNKINISAVTGDFVMQNPYYRCNKNFIETLELQLLKVLNNMSKCNIKIFVFPLVDNGMPQNNQEIEKLILFFKNFEKEIKKLKIIIAFESGYNYIKTLNFLNKISNYGSYFGINYDTGNSANLGFNLIKEFRNYKDYIYNIHIKDRIYKGDTVELGKGDTDFRAFREQLSKINYKNKCTLQVARSKSNKHIKVIKNSINFLIKSHILNAE